jgi:hypothetical protein
MVGWRWTATAVVAAYVLYRCLIWPLLTFTIFPPSVVPFWLLPVGLAVDGVFGIRLAPALRAPLGAIAVTAVGFGALWLQTVAFGTPTDLGSWSITQMRTAFEQGLALHMVPVAWTSIWVAALCLLATWSAVTWLAARSVGLDTPRPPTPTIEYGPEPIRDARGALNGWSAAPDAAAKSR